MDHKLFSHIFNDAFLWGSFDREGHLFSTTTRYLDNYISSLTSKQSADLPPGVLELNQACTSLAFYTQTLNGIHHQYQLDNLCDKTMALVSGLKRGQYLLLPGGYSSGSGGHAMVYCFKVDDKGDLLFEINNTGAGINHHAKLSSKEKDLYDPVLTYRIPRAQFEKGAVPKKFFQELFVAEIRSLQDGKHYDSDTLYQEIFPLLSFCGGQIDPPSLDKSAYKLTGSQLSGTCTQRSLHSMLKAQFASVDDYRKFIYGFLRKSFEDYLTYVQENDTLDNPDVRSQVKKAARHLLRIVTLPKSNKPDQSLFDAKQIRVDREWMEAVLGVVSSKEKSKRKSRNRVTRSIELSARSGDFDVYSQPFTPPSWDEVSLSCEPFKEGSIKGGGTLLAELRQIRTDCNSLAGKGDHQSIIHLLDQVFSNLPLPDSLQSSDLLMAYQSINSIDRASQFFELVNELQTAYFTACDNAVGVKTTLPRMMLFKQNVTAITTHVANHLELGYKDTSFFNMTMGLVKKSTSKSPHSVYSANHSPKLDARTTQLKRLFREGWYDRDSNDRLIIKVCTSILDGDPSAKAYLKDLYDRRYAYGFSEQHDSIRKEGLEALFYLFNHSELGSHSALTGVIAKFNLQKQIETCLVVGNRRCDNSQKRLYNDVGFKLIPQEHSVQVNSVITVNQ